MGEKRLQSSYQSVACPEVGHDTRARETLEGSCVVRADHFAKLVSEHSIQGLPPNRACRRVAHQKRHGAPEA